MPLEWCHRLSGQTVMRVVFIVITFTKWSSGHLPCYHWHMDPLRQNQAHGFKIEESSIFLGTNTISEKIQDYDQILSIYTLALSHSQQIKINSMSSYPSLTQLLPHLQSYPLPLALPLWQLLLSRLSLEIYHCCLLKSESCKRHRN